MVMVATARTDAAAAAAHIDPSCAIRTNSSCARQSVGPRNGISIGPAVFATAVLTVLANSLIHGRTTERRDSCNNGSECGNAGYKLRAADITEHDSVKQHL